MTAEDVFKIMKRNRGYSEYERADAWYTGDEMKIRSVSGYGTFWKRAKMKNKLHVPVAADLAVYSADLLFGEMPGFYVDNHDVGDEPLREQRRLTYILENNDFYSQLHEAAERCAALGDVYLKINWDKGLTDTPIINVVQAEFSLPEYEQGITRAIHFLTRTADSGGAFGSQSLSAEEYTWIYERYETGSIVTEAYRGTADTLGSLIDSKEVETGIPYLLAVHIPNMLPNRIDPGSRMGRSDYSGLYPLFDALDEAYSSWIRDLSLGKARLIVPTDFLRLKEDPLTGKSDFMFDREEDLFVTVDANEPDKLGVSDTQFAIRSNEHKETCLELLERIVTSAGYSPQSFGIHMGGRSDSGTALNMREKKTQITKAKKELYWKTKLQLFLRMLLEADKRVFGQEYRTTEVTVEIKDQIGDIGVISETISRLSAAGAASTYTKVQMAHPDWTDGSITEEVKKIFAERGDGIV